MKKIFTILLCLTVFPASAISIYTPLKWNGIVIEAAMREAFFIFDRSVNNHYYRLLKYLLALDTFSIQDAVEKCVDLQIEVWGSEDMENITYTCESFGTALVAENNKRTESVVYSNGKYSPLGKVYGNNGSFYAEASKHVNDGKCYWDVFESKTNKKIAVCNGIEKSKIPFFDTPDTPTIITFTTEDPAFKKFDFSLECAQEACVLNADGYKGFYKQYEDCLAVIEKINFLELGRLINTAERVFYMRPNTVDKIYLARYFMRNNSASSATKDLYYDMYKDYSNYCDNITSNGRVVQYEHEDKYLWNRTGEEFLTDTELEIEKLKQSVKNLTNIFYHPKYKDVAVKDVNEVTELIQKDANKSVFPFYVPNKVTCEYVSGSTYRCRLGGLLDGEFEFKK